MSKRVAELVFQFMYQYEANQFKWTLFVKKLATLPGSQETKDDMWTVDNISIWWPVGILTNMSGHSSCPE